MSAQTGNQLLRIGTMRELRPVQTLDIHRAKPQAIRWTKGKTSTVTPTVTKSGSATRSLVINTMIDYVRTRLWSSKNTNTHAVWVRIFMNFPHSRRIHHSPGEKGDET